MDVPNLFYNYLLSVLINLIQNINQNSVIVHRNEHIRKQKPEINPGIREILIVNKFISISKFYLIITIKS